jgi:hypothetical protein
MTHQGFISKVISEHLVLVEMGNQQWRIIASEEIARLGGHRCALQNSAVSFNFDGRSVSDFQIDLSDHGGEHEISTITFVKHRGTPSAFGFMRRNECGCFIAFHFSEVFTYGEIRVGVTECRHHVEIVDRRAVATEIELFVPAVSQ